MTLNSSNQLLILWVCSLSQAQVRGSTQLFSLWAHSSNTLRVSQPLESSLQNSCPPFLTTAQLFTQPNFPTSPHYVSQGPTWPNSSLLQVSPSNPISLVPVSTVPVDVYCLCVSPTSSLFPPVTSSIQVPPGARLPSLLW